MSYETFVRAHAIALGASLVCLVIAEVLLLAIRLSGAPAGKAVLIISRIGAAQAGIGVLAGIGLTIWGPWPWTTPWLLASFALIAVLMAVGRMLVKPWQARFQAAMQAPADATSLRALAADGRGLTGRIAFLGLFVLVMAIMAHKPAFAALL